MSLISEPAISKTPNDQKRLRWRWWYAGIADYRLTHPGCSNVEVAKHLNKHDATIGFIVNSDLYKEYEAQRRAEFRAQNEETLRHKLHGVTIKVLDAIDEKLGKQKDQIPMTLAVDLLKSGLDRLGFAPQTGPAVVIQNNHQSNNVVLPNSVTPSVLEEARMALRTVEAQRLRPIGNHGVLDSTSVAEGEGAGLGLLPDLEAKEEEIGGPTSIDS